MKFILTILLVIAMLDCTYAKESRQQRQSDREIEETLAEVGELFEEDGAPSKERRKKKTRKRHASSGKKRQREGDGEIGIASELNIESGFNWRRDWWKYLLMTVGVLGCLALSMYLCRKLLRMITFACCLAVGGVCSGFVSPYLLPWVNKLLPPDWSGSFMSRFMGYAVTFLVTYFFAMLLMRLIHSPGKKSQEEEQ